MIPTVWAWLIVTALFSNHDVLQINHSNQEAKVTAFKDLILRMTFYFRLLDNLLLAYNESMFCS